MRYKERKNCEDWNRIFKGGSIALKVRQYIAVKEVNNGVLI